MSKFATEIEVDADGTWDGDLVLGETEADPPAEWLEQWWADEVAFGLWFQQDRGGGRILIAHETKTRE